jgi:dihydroorotate dehydrogenase
VIYRLLRPLLFRLDPEQAHDLATGLLAAACALRPVREGLGRLTRVDDPVEVLGLRFPNRLGLAAGFDKAGRLVRAAAALGFGHIEVGTVTPLPQPGHPRPRLFRVPPEGLLNRMGFPSDGAQAVRARLAAQRPYPIPVGVNLGPNAHTPPEQAWRDYQAGLEVLFEVADWFVLNLSSPNTAGLRDLQAPDSLATILERCQESNRRLAARLGQKPRPLLIKVSPDLSDPELEELARACLDLPVDGLVASNTTLARQGPWAGLPPQGGLSGAPLRQRARQVVEVLTRSLGGRLPVIGVGGVADEASARAMRAAGAVLVQVYTGLVYEGPSLPRRLARALAEG